MKIEKKIPKHYFRSGGKKNQVDVCTFHKCLLETSMHKDSSQYWRTGSQLKEVCEHKQ